MCALLMLLVAAAAATDLSAPSSPPPSPAPRPTLAPYRDNYIPVKGGQVKLVYLDSVRLSVRCGSGAGRGLDHLPPAALSTRVRDLSVAECAPPDDADYKTVLERLGVGTLPDVTVRLALPAAGAPLAGASLAALRPVSLTLEGSGRAAPPAPRDLLRGLDALARLEVRRVPLAADALAQAPPSLRSLTLDGAGPTLVPAATLRSLRALAASAEVELEAGAPAPSLRVLSLRLRAEAAPPALSRFPRLETLAVTGWRVAEPAPWADCATLTTLTLTTPGFARLPERWTAACGALATLELHTARSLASLPARLLEGACAAAGGAAAGGCPSPALTRLVLSYGALSSLPMTLFDPVPNLRYLDLTHNKLLTLPNAIFATLTALTNLTLAGNKFRDDVYSRLGTLRALRALDLSGNPDLGDACPGGRHLRSGESQLKDMKNLEDLNLSRTGVTRICRDWRERMRRLVHLRLVSTKVAHLAFEDLQYVRDNWTVSLGARVVLLDSPVRRLDYRPEDEVLARTAPPAAVLVQLNLPLACDCESYRAVHALRAFPAHAALNAGELRCAGGGGAEGPLVRVRLEDMLCASPGWCAGLPAGCACAAREQGAAGAQLRHVRVTCERANLTAVPALPAPPGTAVEWDLRLAGNRIEALEGLPTNLTALDVRECGVRRASAGAAATIAAAARLRLAGNLLECGCEAAPLLEAVATVTARRGPGALDAASCDDGRDLTEAAAARAACPAPRAGWGAGALAALGCVLALLALAAASLGAALARPERRARVKGVLLRWGWLPRATEPEEARPYDVFVSFAHADGAAARELAARLEAGAAPLRLCLHSRDWAPGEYIDAQIAASVRSARRTLALVSRAWLRSRWSRVELREALAGGGGEGGGGEGGTRRLVLVLLEDASVLAPLDRELRRCMATCTYLQRDHPHFWERLREALPRPLPPAAPAPPAPPPAPGPPEPAAAA